MLIALWGKIAGVVYIKIGTKSPKYDDSKQYEARTVGH
jgi:hypothetical protein